MKQKQKKKKHLMKINIVSIQKIIVINNLKVNKTLMNRVNLKIKLTNNYHLNKILLIQKMKTKQI